MTGRLATAALASCLALACGRSAAPGSASEPPATEAPAPVAPTAPAAPPAEPAPAPTAPMTDTPKTSWRIESGRVGPVELGKALPAELLAGDLESRYLARYIADTQPVDGFQYDDPPVLILLDDGPFSARIERTGTYEDPPVAELRGPGAKAARGGARVKTIMITGAGPATEAGVGVGSTLDALKAAYADLRLWPFPETLGADMCFGKTRSLPGVAFVFATCAKANKGEAVKRVDVSLPTKS